MTTKNIQNALKESFTIHLKILVAMVGVLAFAAGCSQGSASNSESTAHSGPTQSVSDAATARFNELRSHLSVTPLGVTTTRSDVSRVASENVFSVNICNQNNSRLLLWVLEVQGYYPDHSTFHGIGGPRGDEDRTFLDSDLIIPAKKCKIASWKATATSTRGLFQSYPKYKVFLGATEWE